MPLEGDHGPKDSKELRSQSLAQFANITNGKRIAMERKQSATKQLRSFTPPRSQNMPAELDYNTSGCHAFNAATEHIRIGPCMFHWTLVAELELGVLCRLHNEVQNQIRMPVSFEQLLATEYNDARISGRSWAGCVEAIARCVAAFQKAADATEHSACQEITDKICAYADELARKTSPYLRSHLMEILFKFIQNRIYDLAFKKSVDAIFEETGDGFWSGDCSGLWILEICAKNVSEHGNMLRTELQSLRAESGSATEQTMTTEAKDEPSASH